ncbi:hypothetical protein SCATT_27090 [Streptantibioticus cattleyicolor NRRL 8057 = DSM 46488]|uniref:Uncharacterized protein n=1 Tax=Streptantibioticus cattleyicolor (strain ATCC 35852 / DSM 46488 / JCM 4925 / NBRC 14057 / NRRL 8057) TaxID=1003195 RepID=G8X2G4_STREN|nr:hypothetical protein SCATT_27090 [Streptantibioticus cattleyicolor NRRL 8057 = DSM 46488]
MPVNGHLVKVGWFTAEQEPHKLLIICEAAGRRDLLVVPPQTDAAAAARLMSAAADPYNALTATTLMAREAARSAAEAERGREETAAEEWEAEGGHLAPVPAPPAAPAVLSRPVAGRRA